MGNVSLYEPQGNDDSGESKILLDFQEDENEKNEKPLIINVDLLAERIEDAIAEKDKGKGRIKKLFYEGFLWFEFYEMRDSKAPYNSSDYMRKFDQTKHAVYVGRQEIGETISRCLMNHNIGIEDRDAVLKVMKILRARNMEKNQNSSQMPPWDRQR